MKILLFGHIFCFMLFSACATAELVVSHRVSSDPTDRHYAYTHDILQLALEKTQAKYGDYRLNPITQKNYARSIKTAVENTSPNFFIEMTYAQKQITQSGLVYINFPVDFGVMGYRICFVSPKLKAQAKTFTTIDQLKPYVFGHGIDWVDTIIFRHNGLTVNEIDNYKGVYLMLLAGRIDFYCRGINEIGHEQRQYSDLALEVDNSFILVYPLPRLLYISPKNTEAKQRVEEGLRIAYMDGSLAKLWLKIYKVDLLQLNLEHRHVIHMENPLIKGWHNDMEQNPLTVLGIRLSMEDVVH